MKFRKPKFWDLNKPSIFSYILFPLTLIIRISNLIHDSSSLYKSKKIKTICVGNIYIGGTGKTPTTIELFNITKKLGFNVVTAKKFYSSQIDEQLLLSKKSSTIIDISRKRIVETAIINKKELVIFDDGLQDKKVDYNLKFVCFNADEWIGNGKLIPSGPLREKLSSLVKFDAAFIKGHNSLKFKKIFKIIKKINSKIKIYSTNYKISNLKKFDLKKKYLLFCGVGSPDNLKKFLKKQGFQIISEIFYPDHYSYKISDIRNIISKAKKLKLKIITTHKDYIKISKQFKNKINFIDIKLKIKNEKQLKLFLKKKLNEKN
jgi:tetraacyldisaccharide 4'-kinase